MENNIKRYKREAIKIFIALFFGCIIPDLEIIHPIWCTPIAIWFFKFSYQLYLFEVPANLFGKKVVNKVNTIKENIFNYGSFQLLFIGAGFIIEDGLKYNGYPTNFPLFCGNLNFSINSAIWVYGCLFAAYLGLNHAWLKRSKAQVENYKKQHNQ